VLNSILLDTLIMLLDTPVCDFGWKARDFTLNDADGNSHTLSNSYGPNGLF